MTIAQRVARVHAGVEFATRSHKVGQLEIKPLTELSLDANSIALRKAVTVVAGSDKLFTPRKVTGHAWRHGPGGGQHAAPRSCSTPLL
jgi:hypothetical protein